MEESLTGIDIYRIIKDAFDKGEADIRTYSPLTLAFIGDGIYDLIIRSVLIAEGDKSVEKLHKQKSKIVKAESQAVMIESLSDFLTEEEADVYRRGRNAKSYTTAKNASVAAYRKATGFEALCGYLYMTGKTERLYEIVREGLKYVL